MSILLEALRKSEKGQRAHETPTIHTDNQQGSVSESFRIVPLALLLAVALLLAGWFVWKQYQPPAGSYQPPVTLEADRARPVSKPVEEEKTTTVQAEPAPPSVAAVEEEKTTTVQAEPAPTPVAGAAPQNRTPVETYQAPPQAESEPANAKPAATATKRAGVSRSAPDAAGMTDRKESIAAGTGAGQPAEDSPEPFRPGEPEPIGYWELPDSVRSSVPEIRFSVLVYAADPADRFVLINGQRFGEGDSVQPGLVVKEIRREGVVFSYRLYQFLVER